MFEILERLFYDNLYGHRLSLIDILQVVWGHPVSVTSEDYKKSFRYWRKRLLITGKLLPETVRLPGTIIDLRTDTPWYTGLDTSYLPRSLSYSMNVSLSGHTFTFNI